MGRPGGAHESMMRELEEEFEEWLENLSNSPQESEEEEQEDAEEEEELAEERSLDQGRLICTCKEPLLRLPEECRSSVRDYLKTYIAADECTICGGETKERCDCCGEEKSCCIECDCYLQSAYMIVREDKIFYFCWECLHTGPVCHYYEADMDMQSLRFSYDDAVRYRMNSPGAQGRGRLVQVVNRADGND